MQRAALEQLQFAILETDWVLVKRLGEAAKVSVEARELILGLSQDKHGQGHGSRVHAQELHLQNFFRKVVGSDCLRGNQLLIRDKDKKFASLNILSGTHPSKIFSEVPDFALVGR
jgi:hypothetical protein